MKKIVQIFALFCSIFQTTLYAGHSLSRPQLSKFPKPPLTHYLRLKLLHEDQNLFFHLLPRDLFLPISEFINGANSDISPSDDNSNSSSSKSS